MKSKETKRGAAMIAAAMGAVLTACACGCDEAEEFRAAAGDSLKQGVNLIADGVIEGIFAVFEPDTTTSQ